MKKKKEEKTYTAKDFLLKYYQFKRMTPDQGEWTEEELKAKNRISISKIKV